jgi:hypothetical protein
MSRKEGTKTNPDVPDENNPHLEKQNAQLLHTGSMSEIIEPGAATHESKDQENMPALHTGFEGVSDENLESGDKTIALHTGNDPQEIPAEVLTLQPGQTGTHENTSVLHTGTESNEFLADPPGLQAPNTPKTSALHTGTETAPQQEIIAPRKSRKRKIESQSGESDTKPSQSGNKSKIPSQSGDRAKKPTASPSKPRRKRQPSDQVLSIDDQRTVETREGHWL